MVDPVLPGFVVEEPTGAGPLTGRSLLDGSRVVVERMPASGGVGARAARLSDAVRLADGRHLARVRAVFVAPDVVTVVRDHVDGPALSDELAAAGGTLPLEVAVRRCVGVLDALADLHAAGLTHGALDADVVRLDASVPLRPAVRLTGWGTAALLGRPGTPAADVAAAGRLLQVLVTGSADGPLAAVAPRRLGALLASLRSDDPAARPGAAAARDALAALPLAGAPAAPSTRPRARPRAAPTRRPASAPRAPTRRSRPLLLAPFVALVLAVAAGLLLGQPGARDDAPAAAPAPATSVPYDFSPVARPDGLVVLRRWVLEEDGAVLRGTTVVRNDGDRPTSAGVDEVVPKSVADDVDDLAFSPRADAILERDPVVRFNVLGLAPGATTRWQFVVTLPAPVTADALPRLAADAEQARLEHEAERRRVLEQLRASASPQPDAGELTPPPD